MTLRVSFDTNELLRFTRRVADTDKLIHRTMLASLNEVGDATVERIALSISRETGLDVERSRRLITVQRASSSRAEYRIAVDYRGAEDDRLSRGKVNQRELASRDRNAFKAEMLVNVVTAGDNNVCPICEQIAEEGPYSPDELAKLKSIHPHFLNPTFHCRCALVPFRPRSRLQLRSRSGRESGVESRDTLNQLADKVRNNLSAVLRARKV